MVPPQLPPRAKIRVPLGRFALGGSLGVPEKAKGLVLMGLGSGGSPGARNTDLAATLERSGFATLLFDLLTDEEKARGPLASGFRFDVDRLAERWSRLTDWVGKNESTAPLPLGYFASSTGASGALVSAARHPRTVAGVVSRGGRPDLAGPALARVRAPTLLIVGEQDSSLRTLNEHAQTRLSAPSRLVVVPGTSEQLREAAAAEHISGLASSWFDYCFQKPPEETGVSPRP
ncbi:MAG TPA: alpha/beta hydrolase [Thermoanaerobaculia bacterium]|nr:alpha/beta hydrolase [Thermoanaerobaculia bacterium]